MEKRVALLRDVVEVELVAEIGRVLRQHAVPEQAEDGRVFALQLELELRLVFVELVEIRHAVIVVAPAASPNRPHRGRSAPDPGRAAAAARTGVRPTPDEA